MTQELRKCSKKLQISYVVSKINFPLLSTDKFDLIFLIRRSAANRSLLTDADRAFNSVVLFKSLETEFPNSKFVIKS